jgi:hypothetical protein
MVDSAAIVLLREVVGGMVLDFEFEKSMKDVPEWIASRSSDAR